MAEAARGQVTKLAATHGDMNLRNLIIGPQGTHGIDFGAIHTAPIGHDLARFVANFANFFYPEDAADGDPQWLEDDFDAFSLDTGPTDGMIRRSGICCGWKSLRIGRKCRKIQPSGMCMIATAGWGSNCYRRFCFNALLVGSR